VSRTEDCKFSGDDGLTFAERHAEAVLQLFPDSEVTRTRDAIQLDIYGEAGCKVLITREAAELRLPTIEWTMGSYGPRQSSRLWKRIVVRHSAVGYRRLGLAINAAIAARRSEFRDCAYCGTAFPPERMTDGACHGCASTHMGIVY
jgi:hypothetical protein